MRRRAGKNIERAEVVLTRAVRKLGPGPWDYDLRKALEHLVRARRHVTGPPPPARGE